MVKGVVSIWSTDGCINFGVFSVLILSKVFQLRLLGLVGSYENHARFQIFANNFIHDHIRKKVC